VLPQRGPKTTAFYPAHRIKGESFYSHLHGQRMLLGINTIDIGPASILFTKPVVFRRACAHGERSSAQRGDAAYVTIFLVMSHCA
jgi:hypothetical protein